MGELLAKNEVYLFAANLLQKLEFLPANSQPLPDREKYLAQESILINYLVITSRYFHLNLLLDLQKRHYPSGRQFTICQLHPLFIKGGHPFKKRTGKKLRLNRN